MVKNLTLRPLMPPFSFSIWKYASPTRPSTPYSEPGPECGTVCPSLISVSLAPGSYFFSAAQTDGAGITDGSAAASVVAPNSRRVGLFFIVVSLPYGSLDQPFRRYWQ